MWTFETRRMADNHTHMPRIAVTGPVITTISVPELKSDDSFYRRVQTPDEARNIVQALIKYNPNLIDAVVKEGQIFSHAELVSIKAP